MSKTKLTLITLALSTIASAQSIHNYSIDTGGASSSNGDIQLLYTVGEVFVAEQSAGDINLSEGFINPELDININPKIFLQGPYDTNTNLMFDGLRSTDNIPTTSPYADAATTAGTVFNEGGTSGTGLAQDDIIDWIWVEIRDSVDGITVISSTSALLQADGDIVDVDGVSLLTIDVPFGNYYLMLGHRNHLGILSASTVSLAGGIMSLDLTDDNALVTGGTNGISDMGDGNFALYSGDYSGNGQVQNDDVAGVIPSIGGPEGYLDSDIDMNSQVQNTDILNKIYPNIGKGEQSVVSNLKLYAKRKSNKN